jgi:serine incorporator 1/3
MRQTGVSVHNVCLGRLYAWIISIDKHVVPHNLVFDRTKVSYGSGTGWLHAIVGVCVAFYSTCAVTIGLLYTHFADCPGNTWVITLTLLAIIGLTALQLAGTEGSLLTSSVISLYTVYLCFSIVSKNPRGECNPRLGKNDVWGITIGLLLTTVSLAWTGWSWSAEARLNVDAVQSAKSVQPTGNSPAEHTSINLDVPLLDGEEAGTSGLVSSSIGDGTESASLSHVWKLNIVMALISCYVAMILTSWGTVDGLDENHNAANPTIGRWNMAILGLSQWLAIGLYAWTLLAPKLFPDRDFS